MTSRSIMFRMGQVGFGLTCAACILTLRLSVWWVFAVLFLAFASGYYSGASRYMHEEETP